ncbi:hypothetical protein D3C78_1462310 [compost metagenome]
MVVEVADAGTGPEQPRDIRAVLLMGDVQHCDPLARAGLHARKQADVALHPADQPHLGWQLASQTQLLQRTEAVRIAVEGTVHLPFYLICRHVGLLCSAGLSPLPSP